MLQQPTRAPGNFQLPYTTADMAERLAKKKAAKDRQDILDSFSGGLSYGKSGIDLGSVAKSVGGFLKKAYDNAEMSSQISTPLMMDGAGGGVSMGGQGTFKSLVAEPARLAVRRAVGDITAIPKVGEPSPSYTADRVREQGVALGVLGAAIDYSQFIPVVAKGAGVASDAINASRIARMNRSPFPTVKTPGAFIDVDALQGSRLPARIVDTPATPATRLAEAQAARDAAIISDVPKAPIQVIKQTNNIGANSREPINYRLLDENQQTVGVATFRIEDGVPKLENFFMKPSSDLNRSRQFFAAIDNDMKNYLGQNNRIGATQYNIDTSISQSALRGANTLAKRYNVNFKTGGIPKDVGNNIIPSEATWQEALAGFEKLSETPQRTTPVDMVDLTRRTPATPALRLAEAQTQRALPPAPTPEMTAQIQRQTARTELGLNIQDIEFPPKGKELLRPRMVDDSGYGVFPEGSWPELGLAQYNAGVNNVTMPVEMKALRNYFSNNYDSFQDILRNIDNDPTSDITKSFQKQIEQIDNIFRVTSPTTENFQVFRGVVAGSNMPLVGDRPFVGAFYRSLKEGDLIVEPAYMSTSINKVIAREWANSHPDDYLLIIHAPKGSVAVHPIVSWEKGIKEMKTHMNAPTEQELLFNRGTILRIIDNDMGVIHAEMVLPDSTTSNPISTSGIKGYLLKKYSYKDLAEMVADEEAKISFYEEHLQTLPDVKDLMTRTKGFLTEKDQQITRRGGYLLPGMMMRDLANTIADLNKYASGSPDPSDYWTFRDIVNQITQANQGVLAKPKDHQHYAKQLLSLLDKYRLLDDDIVQFLQDNLNDVLMLGKPNP